MGKLMYHLLPGDPDKHGDILLFLDEGENLDDNSDYLDFKLNGWVLWGVFRLTLASGREVLPGYVEA